jgi:hemerythrin-like domain-containing protein
MLSFTLYHRAMRAGARRLEHALDAADTPSRLEAIGRWFEHFRTACLIHAEGEDTVLWPALAAADERKDLVPVFERMDAEHAELAQTLDALAEALGEPAQIEAGRKAASHLVELVDRHLDHEEATAVPALVDRRHDDLGDLMRGVQQSAGPQGAAVAVPFFLEPATDEERAVILGAMPPPVREGYESTWRDAYAGLVAALG